MSQLLPRFEAAYAARIVNGSKPTGMIVSEALWLEMIDAGQIILLKAQIDFTGNNLPGGATISPVTVDEMLFTYRGTIVHIGPHLSGHQAEFSPR